MLKFFFAPFILILRYIYKQYLFMKLQSDDYDTRFNAAYVIVEKFGIKAVSGLIYLLRHKNSEIRNDVAYCLEQITGRFNGDSYEKWKTWWGKNKDKVKKKYYSQK